MKKIATIVGHNRRRQGAVRRTDGKSEFIWNTDLARRIREFADCDDEVEVRIFFRPSDRGYAAQMRDVYRRVDEWGADCSIELHFNASADSDVSGTETLSSGTSGSLSLCRLIQESMCDALGLADRGVKIRSRGDRGGLSLWSGRAPAAMVEPYFGSNSGDCIRAEKEKDALAFQIYQAARDWIA